MPELNVKEKQFEEDIQASLCTDGGYIVGDPKVFDRKLALDKAALLEFIKTTQNKAWYRYEKLNGKASEEMLINRFVHVVKQQGLLSVLRNGFIDRGIKFRVVYWKPETGLSATSQINYDANILHCTRQLHYSLKNENSIDIVLFLNGIPIVSMELKCQFTGQNTTNAINQYKFDRAGKDAIFAFKERVLVHFAVDLDKIYMTTKLEGSATYFLPFNQGSNGAGKVGGAGNPANPEGYASSYLWESVLTKDRLLEIIHKYMHLVQEKDDKGEIAKEIMIFPRYHQLDVVTKLLADAKANGAGHNYLVEHSAGSGKSNSIAWLAYRLSSLHDANDNKIFKSVIIVTDRKVLDKQLQDTVGQFEQVAGTVQKVTQGSKQLQEAIENDIPIIITTLQKFPYIYENVKAGKANFAVIVDEAHSSQTGNAAKKLKRALADTEDILEEYAEWEAEEGNEVDPNDALLNELAAQGFQKNISFFAFTATPKDKTLNMFGNKGEDGRYHPYHIYSMCQAIEEGFILDVLKNYMTYNMYYKIIKQIADDPELDSTAGLKAIAKFESLHPHNIAQKTAIMLEQFRNVTSKKMGGKAKAMLVTASRLHAVRYCEEFRRQIKNNNYNIDVLVAFSGEVKDKGVEEPYTEEGMNIGKDGKHIKESALPKAFKEDGYGILIVAEKYQTGFDEPLLHTMFVDKKLSGVKAVQTLSRLNRTMKGKQDTFVLDFVNSAEDIKKSFEPYYEETVLEKETEPNVIYDIKSTLDNYHLYLEMEVEKFGKIFFSEGNEKDALGKAQGQIKPALDRFDALEPEKADLFKTTLARFNRIYSFVTQVCRFFDKQMHVFSVYAKFLYKSLPSGDKEHVDVEDKIQLEYYKLEKDYEGSIELEPSEEGFNPITGETGRKEKKKDPLTVLIDQINKRFGTSFTEMDKVLMQVENDCAKDTVWADYAKSTDFDTFHELFNKKFMDYVMDRFEQNNEFFVKLTEDEAMLGMVSDTICRNLYSRVLRRKKPYAIDHGEGDLPMVAEH